ncbi:unnamed protein product [Dibothriocephalus latus]|uniref:Uncharacterized protein n=1 Tax=Dibothriocephalus latus TaxID=60516 RepID=A0A3P6TWW5_DIBLA|nr:unnamed protein product [Dibothriocephalus latus]
MSLKPDECNLPEVRQTGTIIVSATISNDYDVIEKDKTRFDFYRYPILHRPPHGLQLYKGSVHVALSWAFVDFIFTDPRVRDLLDFLPHVGVPDEAFFSTVNHNALLNAPGGFPC